MTWINGYGSSALSFTSKARKPQPEPDYDRLAEVYRQIELEQHTPGSPAHETLQADFNFKVKQWRLAVMAAVRKQFKREKKPNG